MEKQDEILVILGIPLLDLNGKFEVYSIHNLPVPFHAKTLDIYNRTKPVISKKVSVQISDMIGKYDLKTDAL